MNNHVQVLCGPKFSFLWDKCPEMQLLGHMRSVCLAFKETAKLFSGVAVPFYIPIPTSNVRVRQFLYILARIWYGHYF